MKRKGIPILVAISLTFLMQSNGFSQNPEYSKLTISIDPMGLLFFGPALNLGWSLNEKTVVKFNVRRTSWGLLANKIRKWDSENELYEFNGMGYAIGANRFLENIGSGYYYGAFFSIDIQNTKYAENSEWSWHEKTTTYGLLANGGKRFKIGSMFYIDAGGVLGFGIVRYNWDYDDPDAGIDDPEARTGTSAIPIGALEFGIGMFLL